MIRRTRLAVSLAVVVAASLLVSGPAAAQTAPSGHADIVAVPPVLSPAPADALYMKPQFTPVKTHDGVVYGRARHVADGMIDLHLEIWEPQGHSHPKRPVIVWAAGNFTRSPGTGSTYWMPDLVKRGYVVASIDYRRRPAHAGGGQGVVGIVGGIAEGRDPVQVLTEGVEASHDAQHDMQAAVRFLRKHASTYGIDREKIIVGGYSAGGATTARVVFNPNDPGTSGTPSVSSHVAAAIIGGGAYMPVVGGGLILPGAPPILVIHGTNDVEAPFALGLVPCLLTTLVLNTCELRAIVGAGHGLSAYWPAMAAETADFLYRNVITR